MLPEQYCPVTSSECFVGNLLSLSERSLGKLGISPRPDGPKSAFQRALRQKTETTCTARALLGRSARSVLSGLAKIWGVLIAALTLAIG